nr:transcription repressor OFP8-like [Ipomoea batatas]
MNSSTTNQSSSSEATQSRRRRPRSPSPTRYKYISLKDILPPTSTCTGDPRLNRRDNARLGSTKRHHRRRRRVTEVMFCRRFRCVARKISTACITLSIFFASCAGAGDSESYPFCSSTSSHFSRSPNDDEDGKIGPHFRGSVAVVKESDDPY